MRIFKLLIILFLMTNLYGQSKSIIINETDTLSVTTYDDVQILLDSLLHYSNDIGEYYILNSINSDSIISYYKYNKDVFVDTLIFNSDEIRKSVLNQLFKSLIGTKPFVKSTKLFNTIVKSTPFIMNDSELQFGKYQEKQIGALIDMKTNFNNYFSGLVGASRSNEQEWSINGQLDIHLENQWKTAGIVDLHWKRLDDESQTLNLIFEEPHPFGLPIGVSATYNQDLREGSFVNTGTSAGIIKTVPGIGKLGFGAKNTRINTTQKGDSLGLLDMSNQSIYVNGIVDYRNDYWLPTKGYFISLYSDVGSRTINDSSTISVSMNMILESYIPIFSKSNISLRSFGSANWLNSGELHTGELIRYGGANSLRGYTEDNFKSKWVIIPSIELNYNLSSNQQITIFSDIALQQVYSPFPFGYGIGLTQITKNSVLKLYYGLGRDDSIKSGKIHLKFLTRL